MHMARLVQPTPKCVVPLLKQLSLKLEPKVTPVSETGTVLEATKWTHFWTSPEKLEMYLGHSLLFVNGFRLSGFAMSLRALQTSVTGKLKGAWNLFGMRSIDTVMKKTAPQWWYNYKVEKTFQAADRQLVYPDSAI